MTSDLEFCRLTSLEVTLTFFTGSFGPFFPEEAVVGLIKAGTDFPLVGLLLLVVVLPVDLLLLAVVLPVDFLEPIGSCLGGEDRKLDALFTKGAFKGVVLVVIFRTVLLLPALLFPELERDKFSFELPESPRLTFAVELGVLFCVLVIDLFELFKLRVRLSDDVPDLT